MTLDFCFLKKRSLPFELFHYLSARFKVVSYAQLHLLHQLRSGGKCWDYHTPATAAAQVETSTTEHKLLLCYQERFIRLQAFLKKCDDDKQEDFLQSSSSYLTSEDTDLV
jgi:hypothetical protein